MESSEALILSIVLFAAIGAAAVYDYLVKKNIGGFVRALIKSDARSPESAKAMEELSVKPNSQLTRALNGGALKRLVVFSEGKYYIPEEKFYKAETMYKETSLKTLFVTVGLGLFAALLFYSYAPGLIRLINRSF